MERAIQVRAAGDAAERVESTQPPRLNTTGDGLKRAGDRSGTREFQQFRFDPQPPRLTETGDAYKAYCRCSTGQTEPPPSDEGKRESSAGAVREDETGANRMTGLVTRDSAQRRQIASIGRVRVITYSTIRPLAPPRRCHRWPSVAERGNDTIPPRKPRGVMTPWTR